MVVITIEIGFLRKKIADAITIQMLPEEIVPAMETEIAIDVRVHSNITDAQDVPGKHL